ncbi:MAG TPA: DUF3040 domain-containing protein [Acidimicrobiales bacterium]
MIDHPEHVELTPGERVLLDDIERSLAAVDPRLAARLSTHRWSGRRWRRARLPAGALGAVLGLAGMVVSAVSGELWAGTAAVALAAGGVVAASDEVRDRAEEAVGEPRRRRLPLRRPRRA